VRFITFCDHFFQVTILRFYNLIGFISMERDIAWTAHLLTCHGFHIYRLFWQRTGQLRHGSPVEEPVMVTSGSRDSHRPG